MTNADPTLTALEKLLAAVRLHADPRRASDEWKQAFRLFQKTALPGDRVAGVIGMRDVDGLADLVEELRNPAAAAAEVPGPEICAQAFQAFSKRFALTMLDEESKLGRNPCTKGAKSSVSGIAPPREWPEPVWRELVRQGKLRYIGHGLYQLATP